MSINCNEINVILGELDLDDSFIQQIVQPTYDSIALYTYKAQSAKTVLICLASGVCRLHETQRRIPKNDTPLRFMEFLRSHVKGARIVSCEQLGLERIVRFTLQRGDEHLYIYVRLWSGQANCIVTDMDGIILDVFYRRPKRGEISGGTFACEVTVSHDESAHKDLCLYPVRLFSEHTAGEKSFNQCIDEWYAHNAAHLSREALLAQAGKIYLQKNTRMSVALKKLKTKRQEFLQCEQWKHYGDLLFAHMYEIPQALSSFECLDYESDTIVCIPLDIKKTVKENALEYYERYKKAQSGLVALDDDIVLAENALAQVLSDYESLRDIENPLIIRQLLHKQNKPKQQLEKKYPGLRFEVQGWTFFVGRTAAENDELLRRHVRGQDMWLHTRDYAGGYVFIKMQRGKSVPLETLLAAGNLALYFSKGRKNARGDVYYTPVKYVRRAKNAPKGTVLPTQEKNLSITLDEKLIKHILHEAKN